MNITIENFLLVGSLLLLISIIAGKASFRFGIPTLILFLVIGMLAGSDGILGIQFDNPRIAQFIGIVSLNFILFSGGMDTDWGTIKPVFWQGFSLSTLGVLLTAVTLGVFVWWITDFSLYEGLLLGAIVSSTDAAAVFSILRSRSLALKSNLRPTLEFESGSNDPMAYVLTIAFLSLVTNPSAGLGSVILMFFWQMIIGAMAGYVFGRISKHIINKIQLDAEGLYPVLAIALMFITFSATDFVGGNGFLAVYLCALYLGNQVLMHKKALIKAFDGFAWLMQIILFLVLGLLVFPSQVWPLAGVGLLISAFLIFVARPVSVFLSLMFFKMKLRRRFYISWVGLKGAVPIVFATYPLIAGIDKAGIIFNIVFFVSLTSLVLQGTSLGIVAKWLHVALPQKVRRQSAVEAFLTDSGKSSMVEIYVPEGSHPVKKKVVDLLFPKSSIIALIRRDGGFITPNGNTVIEANDTMIVLSNNEEGMRDVYKSLRLENPLVGSSQEI
ncbi:MAG: potassium/proton antiporter [Bacteroidales bacterium]|nr:potassium/proton antiporter [Bacteroidales bacterium]